MEQRRARRVAWAGWGLAAVAAWPVAAQTAVDPLRLPLESLLTMEVSSVSRFPQPALEAPALVRVVDDADMRAFGYRTVADALRSLPGVDVANDHSYSFPGIRGFNRPGDYTSRVLLMVDGLRTNDGIYDQALVGMEAVLDTPILKRVEYFAGPSSSVYGGNALFGVANLVTRSGSDIAGWEPRVEVGTGGSRRASLAFGRHFDDGRDLVFYGAAGYGSGTRLAFPEHGGVARDLDGERYGKFFAKFSVDGLRVAAAFSRRTKENPAAPYGTRFGTPAVTMDEHAFLEVSHESEVSTAVTQLVRGYLTRYRYQGDWPYAGPPEYLNRDLARADQAGGEYRLTYRGIANHVLMGGVEVRRNWRLDQRNFDVDPAVTHLSLHRDAAAAGAYLQDEWRLTERWLLNLGLRYDKVSDFRGEWSPRLAAIYRPGAATAVKFLAGQAFRAPNQYERYYGADGFQKANPDVGIERIATTELAVEHLLAEDLRLTGTVFHYDLRRPLESRVDPADGLTFFANGGHIHVVGSEMEAEYRSPAGLRLKGSVTVQDGRDGDHRWLTNSPRELLKAQAYFPALLGWDVGIEWLGTGRRRTLAGTVPPSAVANLTLNRALSADSELRIGVVNVGDRRYRDPVPDYYAPVDAMPQIGRQAYLQWLGRF